MQGVFDLCYPRDNSKNNLQIDNKKQNRKEALGTFFLKV